MEPSEKYCFPCSNTSSPIYYKEERAVKEWEISSSTAASQGLHEASSICTFYHPCLHFTCLQEPSPQGNKTKITAESRPQKQLTWNPNGLCWSKSSQKTPLEPSALGIQQPLVPLAPFTQHWVPISHTEVVRAELPHFCGCPPTHAFPSTST